MVKKRTLLKPSPTWSDTFRSRMHLLRISAGLTQRQLGRRLGRKSGNSIAKLEAGSQDAISLRDVDALLVIARKQGVSPAWLLGLVDDPHGKVA